MIKIKKTEEKWQLCSLCKKFKPDTTKKLYELWLTRDDCKGINSSRFTICEDCLKKLRNMATSVVRRNSLDKVVLSEKTKKDLRELHERGGFQYLMRDKDNTLFALHVERGATGNCVLDNEDLSFIKKEDGLYEIAELLKIKGGDTK